MSRIAAKKAELDGLRPLAGRSLAALDAWYDVELTYTSNALEGNRLTRSETAIVLEKGITVSGKPLKDHLEATGHLAALTYVRELATDHHQPVREIDIRNIHRLVMQNVQPDEAGCYSNHQRTARLLMNLLLLKGGYPAVVIRPEDRPEYHDSLEAAQMGGDRTVFHRFMNARLEAALDHHLEILRRGLDHKTD